MVGFTQTGAAATTPSNPDYRFPLHTRQGVGDLSGVASEASKQIDYQLIGQGVEAAGNLAADVYQGYQLGKLQKDINKKVIDPFISRMGQVPLTEAERQAAIAEHTGVQSGLAEQKQSIFQEFMDTGEMSQATLEQSIQANVESVKRTTDRLQAALSQGQMSQKEVELRLRAVTREHINKNPGMAKALLAHAQLVEQQSGIRVIPDIKNKVDKEAAMLERKKLDFKLSQHKEVNTHIDIDQYLTNPEYAATKDAETAEKYRGREYNDNLKQRVENNDLMSKEEAIEKVPLMAASTTAKFLEFTSNAHALAANAKTIEQRKEVALQLETNATTMIALHRDAMIKNNLPRADINDHVSNLNSMTRNIINAIKDDVSGKPLADILNNTIRATNDAMKIQLNEQFGVEPFKYLSSIASPSIKDALDRLDRTGPRKDKVLRGLIELGSGYNSGAALDAVVSRDMSQNATNAVTAFRGTMESKDYENAEKIIQGIELQTVKLKDQNFTAEDLPKKLEAQESLISEIGKPEYKGKLNFGTTVKSNATNIVRDYLVDAGTVFRREMDKWNNEPHSKNYSVKLSTKLIDGQLKIVGEGVDVRGIYNRLTGQEIADKLQSSVGEAFNRGVKAMANLDNTNWERGSKSLLDAIDQDWYLPEGEGSLLAKETRNNYVDKVIKVESGGVANAKNPNSSATGVGQFISGTWNQMVDKYAPELKQGRTPEEVLALRNDPQISREMTQFLAKDNTQVLKQNNLPATDTNLYLAHFLGASTASMVLRVPDKVKLDDLLDEGVLEANSSVLKGKTVGDLKQWASRKMGGV